MKTYIAIVMYKKDLEEFDSFDDIAQAHNWIEENYQSYGKCDYIKELDFVVYKATEMFCPPTPAPPKWNKL